MAIVIGCFLSVFVMICSAGFLILQRKSPEGQVTTVISDPALAKEARLLSTIQEAGVSIGGMVGHFENVIPKTQAEVSILRQRLTRAGYRNDAAVSIFYGGKFLFMVLMVVLVFATRVASYNYVLVTIAALA